MRQEERYDGIRVCEHDSDYSTLYDFVGMRQSCATPASTGKNTCARAGTQQAYLGNGRCVRRMWCAFAVTPMSRNRRGVQDVFRHARQLGHCAERQQAQIMRIGTIKPKKGEVASRSVVKKTIKWWFLLTMQIL